MALNKVLISVGSNIEREKYTRAGLASLDRQFSDISCSGVYESEAVGFNGSAFYNLIVKAYTPLEVTQVNDILKRIERDNGRTHSEKKFCSRTLDLDLLTFNQVIIRQPIILPREEILYNAFVLQPLAELVPADIHPVTGKTYRQLWQEYDKTAQRLWPVDFTWSDV